jgi:hypothetical protein
MGLRSTLARSILLPGVLLLASPTPPAEASNLYSLARVRQGFTSICQQGGEDFFTADAHCVVPAVGAGFVDTAADAEADALYGELRGYTQLQTTAADGRNYDALATAEFTDTLVINAASQSPGSAGNGKLLFTVDVEHLIIERELTGGSAFPKTDFFLAINGAGRSARGNLPNLEYFIAFEYGVPFEITATLQTKVECNSCSGRYNIVTDGRNTATLDVVTVTGLELSDFTVSNVSGEVYANVVPEPGSAAAGLTAIAAISALRVGRRRGARSRGRRPLA